MRRKDGKWKGGGEGLVEEGGTRGIGGESEWKEVGGKE